MYISDYINKLCKIISRHNKVESYPLALGSNEIKVLKRYLALTRNYLEFGSGGSTFIALIYSFTKIVSVESDINWINYLFEWDLIYKQALKGRLRFLCVDIGETGEWGYPLDLENNQNFYKYSSLVFENKRDFDTVLIDGRFRVACALQTILNCKNPTILIHDYPEREFYHIIEKYLELVEYEQSLYVFKKKKNINYEEVQKDWEYYKNIPN